MWASCKIAGPATIVQDLAAMEVEVGVVVPLLPQSIEPRAGRTFPTVPCHLRTSVPSHNLPSWSTQGLWTLSPVRLVPVVRGMEQAHPTSLETRRPL